MSLLIITNGKISDSLSTVPLTHIENVTASRSVNVTYTNTTGKTLFVIIDLLCNTPAVGDIANIVIRINNVITQNLGIGNTPGSLILYFNATFVVRPGDTYKIQQYVAGTGVVEITTWMEYY